MVPTTLLNVLDEKPFLKELSNLYAKNGFQIYLVGGAVRDGILGIETKDFDFTTNASPEESINILNKKEYKTTEIGKAFGTIETTVEDYSLHIYILTCQFALCYCIQSAKQTNYASS